MEQDLERAKVVLAAERERVSQELSGLREDLRARDAQLETVHAEVQTLHGALEQSRAERARLKREAAQARNAGAVTVQDPAAHAALRQEILAVAERLMALPPKQEAAE